MAEIVNLRRRAQAQGARRCRNGGRRQPGAIRPQQGRKATRQRRQGAGAQLPRWPPPRPSRRQVSSIVKRSVTIKGHRTSLSLEQPFFDRLVAIAATSEHSARSADRRGRRDAAKGCEPLFGAARIRARASDAPAIARRKSREEGSSRKSRIQALSRADGNSVEAYDHTGGRSGAEYRLSFPVPSGIRRAQADRSGGPSRHWLAERPAPRAIACF